MIFVLTLVLAFKVFRKDSFKAWGLNRTTVISSRLSDVVNTSI